MEGECLPRAERLISSSCGVQGGLDNPVGVQAMARLRLGLSEGSRTEQPL